MQPSSSMSPVPPAEDLFRRLEYRGVELRDGQKEFVQYVSDHPDQNVYNGVLPTGYGKSKAAECACDVLKQQGRANRFLFVVPTDTQRTQYAEGIGHDVAGMGLNLKLEHRMSRGVSYSIPATMTQTVADLRLHRENLCEVFVTTIQSIHSNEGFYSDLMSSGSWCVFADEYQKLNREDSAKWGKAMEALNYTVLFGLTATPVRTDRKDTIFARKPPDVFVSFGDAYKERAIRRVVAHIEHYFVDILIDDDEGGTRPERLTTENIDDYDLSRELRYTTKYYASILGAAHDCMEHKNQIEGQRGQHQMLVFAMKVGHAKSVSDTLNVVYGPGFSEWVGVGPDGKTNRENRDVLKRYKANKVKCLVQVDIATEGFDNPRSSVLVFLNLMKRTSVKATQGPGRGTRRNTAIEDFAADVCDMFASPDTDMAGLITDLAAQTLDPLALGEDAPEETDEERKTPIYSIGPFDSTIRNTEYDRSEIISKIPQAEVDMLALATERKMGVAPSMDDVRAVLVEERIRLMEEAQAQGDAKSNKEKVKEAMNTLIGNVVRLLYRHNTPKGASGDIAKAINGRWVFVTRTRHSEMLDDDFRAKHDWLKKINDEIKSTRSVPLWLQR